MAIPEDRLYSEEHLWVKKERGLQASIGLSTFVQRLYGEILDFELPEEGDELVKGEVFGSVESSKGVEELVAPVSGEVVEVNEEILEDPEIANGDPYGDGWLIKIKLSDPDELEELMAADEYEDFLEERGETLVEEEEEDEEFIFKEEE